MHQTLGLQYLWVTGPGPLSLQLPPGAPRLQAHQGGEAVQAPRAQGLQDQAQRGPEESRSRAWISVLTWRPAETVAWVNVPATTRTGLMCKDILVQERAVMKLLYHSEAEG